MSDCPRVNYLRGHCKFEARYDRTLPTGNFSMDMGAPSIIEAIKDKRYVRDVCVRCGKTIERAA